MAYLWCDDCALIRADNFANSKYIDGESVVLAAGALTLESVTCDACNATIDCEDEVVLVYFLPSGQEVLLEMVENYLAPGYSLREYS